MGSRLEKNSNAVRKRIEGHTFSDETGEEYEPSAFGGFPDYFRRKKIKLQNLDSELRASSANQPQIFKGIVAHVTGYTQPPLHVLHRDLVQHGAGFLQYLDSKTMATHIIASSLPPKKMIEFSKYRIVKPAWVTDSIQAGKLLPWSDYRVIEETPRQKTLKFDGGKLSTQANTQSSPLAGYREQTENGFYTGQLKGFAEIIDKGQAGDQSPSKPVEGTVSDDVRERGPLMGDMISDASNGINQTDSAAGLQYPGSIDDYVLKQGRAAPAANAEIAQQDTGNEPLQLPQMMTSEEHNALLLQDPRMRKSSTANPDFIQQYYSESRLHHLSAWKAELKSRMQKLAAEKGPQARAPKRKPGTRRYIMHVDFDSFFCAVSLISAPEYIDKPTVVAHGAGIGSEIASCNYAARKFGVKNGMWMKRGKELCPDLKVLPYDFPAYEEASRLFYESTLEIGGVVQSVSIDEALVDVSLVIFEAVGSKGIGADEGSIWREQEKADQIALALRDNIKAKTGCAVSVGIGGSILLAKVALRKAKPAGQFQMKPEDTQGILGELKVDDLPGVAYSIAGKLEEIGVKYVNDIRQVSKERLTTTLGPRTGEKLWEYARGIDFTEVGDQPIRKSVSAEVNWGIRFINQEEAEEFIFNLCKELERRLMNEQVKGKHLTLKIMRRSLDAPLDPAKHLGHGKCDTFNKSTIFGVATHAAQAIGKEAVSLLRSFKFSPGDLRGLGVQLTKLEPIKISTFGPESSQKKLSFGAFQAPDSAKKPVHDPIQEVHSLGRSSPSRNESKDPIIDGPLTPRKPKPNAMHPAFTISKVNEKDTKSRTPLNIGGTQFVLPTNTDPAVLAELPPDIRSKLIAQGQGGAEAREASPPVRSRTESPALVDEMPPDIDPDVFNALPEDMKAEILASYRPRAALQSRMPHSPHKDRLIQPSKKTTPTKRRGPGLFSKARERHADATNKVVQTSFRSFKKNEDAGPGDVEELDQEFLAELPEEVRKEIIADHRQRKAQRSGLDLKISHKRHQEAQGDEALPGGQMRLQFAPRPRKIRFTSAGLTTLPEIRDMLNVWHKETGFEGPHRRDVEMFEKYLVKVILEEKDLDKASKLVQWLDYLIDEDDSETPGNASWRAVTQDIKSEVQEAVRQRGLAPLGQI
ncbi:impB/mucB/samB family protein [Xylariales sp. AK1849]|nr:impB/mucB/samB family protein [Xylariales sp. AK1849]